MLKKKIILFVFLASSFYLTGIFALPIAYAAPAAPSDLTATGESSSTIRLRWTDNSDNESEFSIYRDGGSGYYRAAAVAANATSYLDTGLAENHTYNYRICAWDPSGCSVYSNVAAGTTLIATPNAPTNLTATVQSSSQINLTWQDNSNNETGFKIDRAPSDTGPWAQVGLTSNNTSTYSNTGLNPWTTYYYRVYAYRSTANSAYTNIANAATPAPPSIPNPSILGFLTDFGLEANDVVMSPTNPDIVYIASSFGLVIVNVSEKDKPKVLNDWASQHPAGPALQLAVSANTVVAAGTPRGTDIIDISDPTFPRVVASIPGYSSDAAISGNYAYITSSGDVKVVDISNPPTAYVAATIVTPGIASGTAVLGDTLAVADSTQGIQIYNIANPRSPFPQGSKQDLGGRAAYLALSNIGGKNYAVVANQSLGKFQIIDISNPSSLRLVSEIKIDDGAAINLDVVGDKLYLALNVRDVGIYDIGVPSAPRLLGIYESADNTFDVSSVAASGNYVFAIDNERLAVINATNPNSMFEIGSVRQQNGSSQLAVDLSKNLAIMAGTPRGTDFIDISNSSKPRILASIAGISSDAAISGNYAYLASAGDLKVVDISVPASASVVKTIDLGIAYGVAVSDNLLVVDDAYVGLKTYDVSGVNAANPQYQGAISLGGLASKVALTTINNIKYALVVNSGPAKLQVVNVQIPSSPTLVKEIATGSSAVNVTTSGNYAYVAGNDVPLYIIDLVNLPSDAPIVGIYDNPDTAYSGRSSYISNNMAFIAAGGRGIGIVDVSTPSSPKEIVHAKSVMGDVNDIVVVGGKIYVTDSLGEIVIMDIYHDELKVTKTPSIYQASSGQEITYTLAINNPSPNTMTNLTVTDPIPTGTTFVSADHGGRLVNNKVTWDTNSTPELTTFAPSANLTLTFRVRVN